MIMATEVRFERTESVAATVDDEIQLVTFRLEDQEYALDIANVVQVVRMVATTSMPEAPKIVRGVINVRGKVIPVIDVRKRFNLPAKVDDLNTQLLIAQMDGRLMALIVDAVSEVLTMPAGNIEPPSEIAPQMERLSAVGKLGDRLLLMLDLNRVLTVQEETRLRSVLAEARS
jgi:purine-binding chemotaxis protein CheW